jgi:imidazolonepropionase-like amidohydrolase
MSRILLCLSLLLTAGWAQVSPEYLIRVDRYFCGEEWRGPATIMIGGGRILSIESEVLAKVPAGVKVVRIQDAHLVPPLVLADSDSFLRTPAGEESVETHALATDAFDPFEDYQRLVKEGIRYAYLSAAKPRLVSGQGGVVDLHAKAPGGVIIPKAALQANVTREVYNPPQIYDPPMDPGPDNPSPPLRRQEPTTRAGAFHQLRTLLSEADRCLKGVAPLPAPGPGVPDLRPVMDVLLGKIPLRVEAEQAPDIRLVCEICSPYESLRLIIVGAAEGAEELAALKRARATVVLPAGFAPGSVDAPPEPFVAVNGRRNRDLAGLLNREGIPVVLIPPDRGQSEDLLWYAASAQGTDFGSHDVMRAVTTTPARMLGIQEPPVVEVDRAASFLLYSGDPLASAARPIIVFSEGKIAVDRRPKVPPLAITARELHTASDQGVIMDGTVVVIDGRISAVGRDVVIPWDAQRITVDTLAPGFIDALGQAGIRGYRELGDGALIPGAPLSPLPMDTPPSTFFDPEFPDVKAAATSGVTAMALVPRGGRAVAGQFSIVKTHGDPSRTSLVREQGGVFLDYQTAPAAEANRGALGSFLKEGKDYNEAFKKYEKEKAEFDKKNAADSSATELKQRVLRPARRPSFREWEGVFQGRIYGGILPPGGVAIRFTIDSATESEVKARVESLPGESEPLSVTLERKGRNLTGTIDRQGVDITVEMQLWRNEISGTWRTKAQEGSILLTRDDASDGQGSDADVSQSGGNGEKDASKAGAKSNGEKPAGDKPAEQEKKPEAPRAPKVVKAREPLRGIVRGEHPLYLSVRGLDELKELVAVTRGDYDVRTVLLSPELAPDSLDTLDELGAALLVGPTSVRREKGKVINPAALAVARGIPVIIGSGQAGDSRGLYAAASYLVRCGLGRTEALKAMTAWAALVLNVSDRIGSIEVGKDADLCLIRGRLFEPGSEVTGAVIDGRLLGHKAAEGDER